MKRFVNIDLDEVMADKYYSRKRAIFSSAQAVEKK